MTEIPDDFDEDKDPETDEDGRGDDLDKSLPDPRKLPYGNSI